MGDDLFVREKVRAGIIREKMQNNGRRVFRHSFISSASAGFAVIAAFVFFLISTFILKDTDSIVISAILLVFSSSILLYLLSITITISDNEISTQTLFITKSIAWRDIYRVSGTDSVIKLHNFDGDLTVSPNSQLPNFEDVLNYLGSKRPDLFNPNDFIEVKKSLKAFFPILPPITILALIFIVGNPPMPQGWPMLVFLGIIIVMISSTIFSTVQSIQFDGRSLFLKYLFSEKELKSNEIESVNCSSQQTRNGNNFFITIKPIASKQRLVITNMNISLPFLYIVLKNWHRKNTESQSHFQS